MFLFKCHRSKRLKSTIIEYMHVLFMDGKWVDMCLCNLSLILKNKELLLEEIGSTSLPTMIFEICALDVADKELLIFLVQEFSAGSAYP